MLQPLRPGGGKYVGSAQKGDRVRVQKKKKQIHFSVLSLEEILVLKNLSIWDSLEVLFVTAVFYIYVRANKC